MFTNGRAGVYNKTAAGTTTFSIPFNNAGTVNVSTGMLDLSSGGTTLGTLTTGSGAFGRFTNNYTLGVGFVLSGAGTFELTGGLLTVSGTLSGVGYGDWLNEAAGAAKVNAGVTVGPGVMAAWRERAWEARLGGYALEQNQR